jgi:hypothetical protein
VAAPVDAGRATTGVSTSADPWAIVNLPASIAAGDLLIMFCRAALAAGTINGPTTQAWQTLYASASPDAADDNSAWFYRWADGSEGASTSVDLAATSKGGVIVWRITGAENPATQPPELPTPNTGTTSANTANGPNVVPTGGSKDYLFLTAAGQDGEVGAYTAVPTNYANLAAITSGTGGLPATNVQMGGGSRQLTAASEDPGVFTHAAAAAGWTGFTVAVHPVTVVPGPVDSLLIMAPQLATGRT